MIQDSTPPLCRGIGTLLILLATILSFYVVRSDTPPPGGPALHRPAHSKPNPPKPTAAAPATEAQIARLTSEIAELRTELEDESAAEEVLSNPWIEWLSYLGTTCIASSFFMEWHVRRKKAEAEAAAGAAGGVRG